MARPHPYSKNPIPYHSLSCIVGAHYIVGTGVVELWGGDPWVALGRGEGPALKIVSPNGGRPRGAAVALQLGWVMSDAPPALILGRPWEGR